MAGVGQSSRLPPADAQAGGMRYSRRKPEARATVEAIETAGAGCERNASRMEVYAGEAG